ncbi:hypothetical protein OFO03_04080 [Campylobacter sp. JMF_02 ED1]|uniref:hypothetical protein n=1 Tax=unclassified Campylobacter TaxID=2593542 RepID=UPI0022E9CE0A|nr:MULTISPECIES: hypothetical protein [unclassified Campylobacter]MDA3049499.1 hypothetical protein [Campylobacter sp. JMF_15 NE4]MDA3051074.1 hypothetical protein [Campylobacter sp. JMF_02 ED1]
METKNGQTQQQWGMGYSKPLNESKAQTTQSAIQNSKQSNGFITPNVAYNLATSGTGALIGASQDSENRLRGALIGAGAGLAGNRFIQAGTKAFFKNQTDNLAQNLPNIAKGKKENFFDIDERKLKEIINDTPDGNVVYYSKLGGETNINHKLEATSDIGLIGRTPIETPSTSNPSAILPQQGKYDCSSYFAKYQALAAFRDTRLKFAIFLPHALR